MIIDRRIGFIVALLIAGLFYQSCKREDQEIWPDNGESLMTVLSDRLTILDSLEWNYLHQIGEFYYFDKLAKSAQLPDKGDYLVYSDELTDICGQLNSLQQDGDFVIMEILNVPINPFFTFLAFSNTIMTLGNGYEEELDSIAQFRNDTLVIEQVDIEVKDNNFLRGVISIDNLSIYELGMGEQFFFMSPEWENGTITRDAQIEWNQDLFIHGKLSYKANDKGDFKDSLLIRKRTYRKLTAQFPVETTIEEWLVFDWHLPGTDYFELQFEIEGESDLSARFQQTAEWELSSTTDFNSNILDLGGWDMLKSGYVNLEFNTIITPVFGGLSDTHVHKKLQLNVAAEAEWPNWQVDGKVFHVNSLSSFIDVIYDLPVGQFETEQFSRNIFNQTGELENEIPLADFTISPPIGFTNTSFKLNGRSSSDLEDDLNDLQVRWDFDGDGLWDTEFSYDKLQTKYYQIPDTYNVVMEVKDTQGAVSSITKQLEVHATTSAPIASFTVSPESGNQADLFTFDASGCYDAEDPLSILEVRWDFENDGLWDTHYSTLKAKGWFFGEPGTFTVKLEVKDSDGLLGTTTKHVIVEAGNIKPTAFYTVNQESGTTETTFVFDASESSDPEDQVEDLLVRWDFENDGVWDTELRTIKTITHQYDTAGDYTVVLEVQDTEGFLNTFSRQLIVSNPNTAPVADFTISPGSGDTSTKFLFDASISTDLEDDISLLEVRWDWNTNDNDFDTEFSTDKLISKQFSEPGTHLVKVEVRDTKGLLNTKVRLVIVE